MSRAQANITRLGAIDGQVTALQGRATALEGGSATANALAAVTQVFTGAGFQQNITLRHRMAAGTTSPTTFRVRAGLAVAGTLTFNGAAGARQLGGVMASSITITEIRA